MSKKVLILSASPRRNGNSDLLCNQFMLGAKEAGHEVTKIFLRDKEINFCIACDGCRRHDGHCVWNDDMADILEKMIEVDVIVMATPVYFYTMNAQIKTLIDRTFARYTEIINKDFYFIATAADNINLAMEKTFEGLRGFTDCLPGAKEKGVIYGIGAWEKGEIKCSPTMQQTYEMGKSL